jgi:hypothetical protein
LGKLGSGAFLLKAAAIRFSLEGRSAQFARGFRYNAIKGGARRGAYVET